MLSLHQPPLTLTEMFPDLAQPWHPASWRDRPVQQMPAYPDPAALAEVDAGIKPIRRWSSPARRAR